MYLSRHSKWDACTSQDSLGIQFLCILLRHSQQECRVYILWQVRVDGKEQQLGNDIVIKWVLLVFCVKDILVL
jgi:hypothetical protein